MEVTLNIDLGELPEESDELYEAANVANIACGGHAGDAASMERAIGLAATHGARLGAHPSYPDRENFGRVHVDIEPGLLRRSVAAQCGLLRTIADRYGRAIAFLKPHGALYHDAARDAALAGLLLDAATESLARPELVVIGPPTGALADEARRRGLRYAREGFADRAYVRGPWMDHADRGAKQAFLEARLAPRTEPGSVFAEPRACAEQALALVASGVVDTICVHGDAPGAVANARAVRAALEKAGALARRSG